MRKARASLGAARSLMDNGFTDDASSRAYYAMFDAARAALIAHGAPVEVEVSRTHSGLISGFGRYIVKAGIVTAELGRTLGQAQHLRLIADYKGDPIDAKDADRLLIWASQFVDAIAATFELPEDGSKRR